LIEGSLGYSQELPNADKGAIPLPENVGTLAGRVDTPANLAYLTDRRESTVNSSASSWYERSSCGRRSWQGQPSCNRI